MTEKDILEHPKHRRIEGVNSRICTVCEELKIYDEFWKLKNSKDGVRARCISCMKRLRIRKRILSGENQQRNRLYFYDLLTKSRECNSCNVRKSFGDYYKCANYKYNIKATCIDCELQKSKQFFIDNPDYKSNWYEENKDEQLEKNREWYKDNKEKVLERQKEYYQENKEQILERSKKWYQENKEEESKKRKERYINNKEYELKVNREWYNNNRDKVRKSVRKYRRNKRKSNIQFRIIDNLRARFSRILNGTKKEKTTKSLLGCTLKKFKEHIESQWEEEMTWENYGFYGWHLDHIFPCAVFDQTCKYQRAVCWHYTNFQPMWATDNKKKQTTIEDLNIEINLSWINKRKELLI